MSIFYTDGSCLGNGKENSRGGFGIVEVSNDGKLISCYSKFQEDTTNNQEELKAIIRVMALHGKPNNNWEVPVVYSDSSYCVNTFNEWMFSWANRGWKKSDKKEPENLEWIKLYYNLYTDGYRIDLRKVKGHNGDRWNELADKLATGKITPEEAIRIYG